MVITLVALEASMVAHRRRFLNYLAMYEVIEQTALDMKHNMTANSAPAPPYLDACAWLKMDPETRKFRLHLPENASEEEGFQLKFWQPIGKSLTLYPCCTSMISMLIDLLRI